MFSRWRFHATYSYRVCHGSLCRPKLQLLPMWWRYLLKQPWPLNTEIRWKFSRLWIWLTHSSRFSISSWGHSHFAYTARQFPFPKHKAPDLFSYMARFPSRLVCAWKCHQKVFKKLNKNTVDFCMTRYYSASIICRPQNLIRSNEEIILTFL